MNGLLWLASASLMGAMFAVMVAAFGVPATALIFMVAAVCVIVVDVVDITTGGRR